MNALSLRKRVPGKGEKPLEAQITYYSISMAVGKDQKSGYKVKASETIIWKHEFSLESSQNAVGNCKLC